MTPLSPHSRKGLSLQLGRVSGLDAAFSTDGLKQLVLVVETPAGTYSTASSPMGVWSEQIIVGFSEVTFKLVEPSRIDKGSATIVGKLVASRKYMYFYDFGVEVAVQLFDEDEPLDAQLFVCPAVSHDPPSKTCSLIIDATLPPVTWIPSQELRLSRADHFLNIAWRKPHSPHEPEQNAALPPSAAQPVSLAANRPQSPLRSISPTNPVMGSIELELVGAINVAMIPRSFGKGLKLNAFVVVSFGRDSFRTSIGRVASRCSADGTALVIWKQRAHFSVKSPAESHYVLSMAVYHRERLQPNRLLGRCQIGAGRLTGNPETRLSLSCRLDDGRPSLLLKAAFTPYNALRRNFWFVLARNFACDPDGTRLNRLGAETMLESLGSAFAPLDELFRGREEMRVDALVDALEEYTIERCSQCMLVSMERCPLCRTSFSGGRFSGDKTSSRNIDIITHLAVCTTRSQHDSPYKVERLMMAGFLTEEYASRKWFVRLLSYMSFGNYRIGSNNGNIFVHDRATGKLVEERIPTYIRLGIRLVFQASRVGRALSSATLRILPESVAELRMARSLCASLTLKQGRRFTDPASLSHIPEFIKYHGINLAEIADPIDSYANFNEFFYRRLKPGARQLADASERVAVSPCDCRINVYATVSEATVFWIKGETFTIEALLGDPEMASRYRDCSMAICRLAPQDYHRFHAPVDGLLDAVHSIPGAYFTVNPMAVRGPLDVLAENVRRVYTITHTPFGTVTVVAIGALMVGSIVTTAEPGRHVRRMDEIGYFAFGGSTVIVLFPAGSVRFDDDLQANSRIPIETLVFMGNSLGRCL